MTLPSHAPARQFYGGVLVHSRPLGKASVKFLAWLHQISHVFVSESDLLAEIGVKHGNMAPLCTNGQCPILQTSWKISSLEKTATHIQRDISNQGANVSFYWQVGLAIFRSQQAMQACILHLGVSIRPSLQIFKSCERFFWEWGILNQKSEQSFSW